MRGRVSVPEATAMPRTPFHIPMPAPWDRRGVSIPEDAWEGRNEPPRRQGRRVIGGEGRKRKQGRGNGIGYDVRTACSRRSALGDLHGQVAPYLIRPGGWDD